MNRNAVERTEGLSERCEVNEILLVNSRGSLTPCLAGAAVAGGLIGVLGGFALHNLTRPSPCAFYCLLSLPYHRQVPMIASSTCRRFAAHAKLAMPGLPGVRDASWSSRSSISRCRFAARRHRRHAGWLRQASPKLVVATSEHW